MMRKEDKDEIKGLNCVNDRSSTENETPFPSASTTRSCLEDQIRNHYLKGGTE